MSFISRSRPFWPVGLTVTTRGMTCRMERRTTMRLLVASGSCQPVHPVEKQRAVGAGWKVLAVRLDVSSGPAPIAPRDT